MFVIAIEIRLDLCVYCYRVREKGRKERRDRKGGKRGRKERGGKERREREGRKRGRKERGGK